MFVSFFHFSTYVLQRRSALPSLTRCCASASVLLRLIPFPTMTRLLLVCLATVLAEARVFRAAFFYSGEISDLGWSYTHNEGRIRAQDVITQYLKSRGDTVKADIYEALSPAEAKTRMLALSEQGIDLIVACSFIYHEEAFALAKLHPSVDVVHISGFYSGPDNFVTAHGRVYHSRYVSGVVAGGTSTAKRVGYITSLKIAEVYRSANAFYLGMQKGAGAIMNSTYVEHKVDMVVIWIDTFNDPVKEREAARRLHAMGCDVIAYHTDTQEGALYAKANGIHSIADNTDGRKIIGETVLTSSNFNWGPIYTELMNRSYSGTFKSGSHNLWYGYPAGVSINYDPSFEVGQGTVDLFHSTVAEMKGGFDPFCYPVWNRGALVPRDGPGGCTSDFYLAVKMQFLVDGMYDIGSLTLHGAQCGNGTRYTLKISHSPPQYIIDCQNCTAGTYSLVTNLVEGSEECLPCPPGTHSEDSASSCDPCPEGTYADASTTSCTPCPDGTSNSGLGNTNCPFSSETGTDLTVVFVIVAIVGVLLLIGGPLIGIRVVRDQMRISKLFSEKAVAMRCAKSIALMKLEELEDIRTIENPSDIIQSFVQIVDNLIEYRRYLPRTILEKYGADDAEADDKDETGGSTDNTSATNMSQRTAVSSDRQIQRHHALAPRILKKNMSFLMANLVGFHRRVLTGSDPEIQERHKKYVQLVQETAQCRGGVPETFTGDRMVVTFNGVRHTGAYREGATAIGLEVLRQVKETLQLSASASVVAGSVLTGHFGSDTMKRFSTLGQSVSWGIALERISKMYDGALITDASISDACNGLFRFKHTLFVVSPKAPRPNAPNLVSIVSSQMQLAENEWMYQLEEATQNPETRENEIFVAIQKGKWEEAEALEKRIPDDYVQNAELATMVSEQKLKLTDMSLW